MANQNRRISVAKMIRDQQRPGRPPKVLTPEKEEKPKYAGMAMTVQDMAEELTVGRSVAYELVQQQGFPSFMIGRRVLVSRKGLQEWIDRQCMAKPENIGDGEEESF